MKNTPAFREAKKKVLRRLQQFVPVVEKVHGGNHPEFHQVRAIFDRISEKITAAAASRPELEEEFAKLREITAHYTIPEDVCETYEAVYQMLAELDQAYHD